MYQKLHSTVHYNTNIEKHQNISSLGNFHFPTVSNWHISPVYPLKILTSGLLHFPFTIQKICRSLLASRVLVGDSTTYRPGMKDIYGVWEMTKELIFFIFHFLLCLQMPFSIFSFFEFKKQHIFLQEDIPSKKLFFNWTYSCCYWWIVKNGLL